MIRQNPFKNIISLGCVLLLAAAILVPGAESLLGKNLLVICIYILFTAFAINRIFSVKTGGIEWIHTSATLPLLIFLSYIGLQLIPVPIQILKIISPITAFDKLQLHSWLSRFQFSTSNPPYGFCIAYNFHETLHAWLCALAFAGMFGLTLHGVGARRQIDILFFILVAAGDLISVGFLLKLIFSASQTLSDVRPPSGFLGMALSLTAGLYLADKAPSVPSIKRIGGIHERFHQVLGWLSPDSGSLRVYFLLISAAVTSAALIFADSGNSMIFFLSAATLTAILTRLRRLPYAVSILALTGPTGVFLGGCAIYGNLFCSPLTDYPAAGIGWGNYHELSFRYALSGCLKTAGISSGLKTFPEIGITGSLLLAGAITAFLHDYLSAWRRRRDLHAAGIGCGVLMSIFFVAIWHGFSADDFSLSEWLVFSAILGTGYAAIYRKGHGYTTSFSYAVKRVSISKRMRLFVSFAIFSGFVIGSLAVLRNEPVIAPPAGDKNTARIALLSRLSEHPADGLAWFELGNLMKQMDDDPDAFLHRYLPAADKAYDIAVYYRPADEALLFQTADYWVWRSRILSDPDTGGEIKTGAHPLLTRRQGIRIFQEKFRKLLKRNTAFLEKSVDSIWSYFPNDHIVLEIIPEENTRLRRDVLRHLARKDSG